MSTNSNATLGKVTLDPKNEAIKPPQKNEYKALFDSMSEMVEVIELIYNKEQQPVDFYIRDVNISFAKLLNKTKEELIDKRITSVIGIIEDYWLTSFATVDKTGEPLRFKSYGAEFDKYYFVSVWKIREGRIGVSFTCITESEKAEIALKKRLKKEKSTRNKTEQKLTEKSLELQNSFDALRSVNTKLAFQNEEKDRGANSLANIKVELEQQVTCLYQAAIVSETDASGTLIFVNDNFCKIFGYQRKELIGKSHAVIKSGKNSSSFIANMWKTISTGKVWKDEIINKAKGNKKFIWLDMTITPFKDIHGNIVKYVGIQFDITAQIKQKKALLKQAEKLALANSKLAFQNKEKEQRATELVSANIELAFQNEEKEKRVQELAIAKELRQFIETSSTPIFGIDHIGLINEWNQASQKVTGYQKEEVLGIHWKTFTPAKSEKKASSVLNLVLEGKQTENFEFSIFSKDKNQVILLVNSSARRDTHGKITGVLAVGQDITELVGYRNELEIKVKERTVKLNQALEKQKELNELKSKFVSTASHEFRTPLTAINFAAGSIKKYWGKMEPNLVEKKLYKIENQVLHMTRLLDDVLMVGQAGAGELKNNPTDVYLGDFINEIIEEVSISREQSHQIDVLDPEDLKKNTVFIDKKLGRNIFINLISNAVKYSANSKKIVIQFSSNKKYIIISVTDFGIGISNTELKTIFNPFSRGKNVDLIQGTGLGLSIVKEAITAMQGKILVNSSIGKGTTFITKLPKTK